MKLYKEKHIRRGKDDSLDFRTLPAFRQPDKSVEKAQKDSRYEMKSELRCMSPYIVQYSIYSSCETDFTFSDKSIDDKPIVCIDYQDAQETAIALMKRMLISITPVSENSYAYTDLSRLLQMSIDSTKPFIEFVWLLGGREVSIYIIEATTV